MNSLNYYQSFLLLNICELTIIVFFSLIYSQKRDKTITIIYEPLIFFILGSSFIYLVIPLLMYLNNWSWHHVVYSEFSYIKANIYVFLYISLVILIYLLLNNLLYGKDYYFNITKFKALSKNQYILLIILILTPALLDTLYLLKYIFSFEFSYYLKNRIILRKGMGLIILISYMGTLIVPLVFANILVKYKNRTKIELLKSLVFFTIFIFLPFIIAYIVMSNRLTALILLVLLLMIYIIIMEKKFTTYFYIKSLIGIFILVIFFSFLGYFRSIHGNISQINISVFFKLFNYRLEHALVGNFGNFEHLVWLIEHDTWQQLYGESYLAGFLNILPRSLFENKLLGGGPHLKNIIMPGSYNLSGENITSYTTGIIVESYMNFKLLGLFILPFFHSILLILLKRMTMIIGDNIILLVLYLYLLFSITFLLMFGEFLGIYTRTLIISIPFIIFYFYSKKEKNIYFIRFNKKD